MKTEESEGLKFNANSMDNLTKALEKLSVFSRTGYDWNKFAQQILPKNAINWIDVQERLNNSLMLFSLSDELREYIRIVNETEGITEEEFEKKFSAEIERSRELGRNGWIPSEHGNPREMFEWYEWVKDSPEKIMGFFEEDNERVLKSINEKLSAIYIEAPYKLYYQNGISAFQKQDYMTAALYLTILFEVRISNLVEFPERNAKNKRLTYSDKYSNYGLSIQKTKSYERTESFQKKRYEFLNVYPALEEYTHRLFCFGNLPLNLQKPSNPEPDYLDRTWLLHGRCCREITKMDCIQLLNALDVCEYVFKDINLISEAKEQLM